MADGCIHVGDGVHAMTAFFPFGCVQFRPGSLEVSERVPHMPTVIFH